MITPVTVNSYIAGIPENKRETAEQTRETIRRAAPDTAEFLSYHMPAYKQNGILVWFAVHKNHIGLYPKTSGIEAFKNELSGYKWAKGSVQFPLNKPIPFNLIAEIVRFRVQENLSKTKIKK